jgi:chlorobactene glucosyltransferase
MNIIALLTLSVLISSLLLATISFKNALTALKHYRVSDNRPGVRSESVPSVTLAIPARNEDHALENCLLKAVNSSYPRLEIIVLDDCSQDKTPLIIKSFARHGVRFVQGDAPSRGWLGKNNAYSVLEKQSSGEYILFMGVDTHLGQNDITELIHYMRHHRLEMLSVLPKTRNNFILPVFFQPLRYIFQILFSVNTSFTAASSELWMIKSSSLRSGGGFEKIKNEILPENKLARYFEAKNTYKFILPGENLAATFGKKYNSLIDTSIRTWYPLLNRSPLKASLLCLVILAYGLAPFLFLFIVDYPLNLITAATLILYMAAYGALVRQTRPKFWFLSLFLLPAILIQEVIIIMISALKYELSGVSWKGRGVCFIEKTSFENPKK